MSDESSATGVDAGFVSRMLAAERARFEAAHGKSRELFATGRQFFLYGAPLHWMRRWAGGFPIYVAEAKGTRLVDVDGNEYVDFCLGDTGGMCGHGHPAVAEAVSRQLASGASMMLPTMDSLRVGEELKRRFALPFWNFAISASEANRAVLRLSRMITGRDKVLVFSGCYHGSVDEAHVELRAGEMRMRNDIHSNAFDYARVSKVVEFNDRGALAAALAPGDVACVLAEPAMTNCGMVLPDPGFHDFLGAETRRTGTVLILDETHTISAGPGGFTGAHGLEPDMLVLGKAIAGGIPGAVFGVTQAIAERVWAAFPALDASVRQSAHGGFGGTLAGSAVMVAAVRATLEHVLTDAAFARMIALAGELAEDASDRISAAGLPWHVSKIGSRVEYMFTPTAPRTGSEARSARDGDLELLLHLHLMNRGVLLTPFHNMLLLCPSSTAADVERHAAVFASFVQALGPGRRR